MRITVPDYYHKFKCIASACPATCCEGWQIVIDEKSINKYRKCRTAFGNRLRNSIDWENRTFLQYDKRCAFLDENQLCDIYTEAGPDMLCRTCRKYPRHIEEFENEREISLSLSCPVVARMILGMSEKAGFVTKEVMRMEEEEEEFDFFLYSALQDSRSLMFDILQDRQEDIGFRMAKVLALAHDVQNRIETRRLFETEALLERYRSAGADEKLKRRFQKYDRPEEAVVFMEELLNIPDEFEILNQEWVRDVKRWRKGLSGEGRKAWEGRTCREQEIEQLLVYFLYTYYCGAVYDGDAFSKVKMAAVSTLLIEYLEIAAETEKGEALTLEERARIVWSYSRELEHSDLNLNQMESMMRRREEAGFERLLTICCACGVGKLQVTEQ